MVDRLTARWTIVRWQLLFLVFGTTWLWAPILNHQLSYRTALISQYETGAQPYSWLFRLCDVIAAGLLISMALVIKRLNKWRWEGILLLVIGIGMLLDPLVATTCHIQANSCQEYVSPLFILHAIETCLTALAFFVLSMYDSLQRKRVVSYAFTAFQIGYALLFLSQIATHEQFNTVSQYVYQTILIVWLAWLVGDLARSARHQSPSPREATLVKQVIAGWAFLNGLLAILISLSHIRLAGRLRGLYFTGNYAWLAQHGVIVGIIMIYLSRHLARGERRARQIFLWLVGIEALKYSVITPNPTLLLVYGLAFCLLFVFSDDFDRGTVPVTMQLRLRDALYMIGSLVLAAGLGLLLLYRNARLTAVTNQALDHFLDFTIRSKILPGVRIRSILLDHTIEAFVLGGLISIFWILFRPYKQVADTSNDLERVKTSLRHYSKSTEDYFKVWPADKNYFWSATHNGFIAYKVVGSIAFAVADPIAPDSARTILIEEFIAWCRSRRLRACFLPVFDTHVKLYEKAKLRTLQIGASALIPTKQFLEATTGEKWWRWQKNRAHKQGYRYQFSQAPHAKELLDQCKAVSDAWLTVGGHQEFSFLMGYFDEMYLQACNLHYLTDEHGQLVAFTNEVPSFTTLDTVTVDLIRHRPDADNTMPYLLLNTIQQASNRGKAYFDLGFVPFAATKSAVTNLTKLLAGNRFSAKGLEQFKNKFKPDWQPTYIAYDGDIADLTLITINMEKAMEVPY